MYHPTSRVLAVLELLQARPSITGPELATRLEMDVRTVRRYIMHLQDAGIPIESNIGRYGGYRLRAGFKLLALDDVAGGARQLTVEVAIEREGGDKPVCIAESLARHYR